MSTFRQRCQRKHVSAPCYVSTIDAPRAVGACVDYLTADPKKWAAPLPQVMSRLVHGDSSSVGEWIPEFAPAMSDNFRGLNRAVDPCRLAGLRYSGSGVSVYEALIGAMAVVAREGGQTDQILASGHIVRMYEKEEGQRGTLTTMNGCPIVHGPYGAALLHEEPGLDAGSAFCLQSDTWTVLENDAGQESLICSTPSHNCRVVGLPVADDAYETRAGFFGQLTQETAKYRAESGETVTLTVGDTDMVIRKLHQDLTEATFKPLTVNKNTPRGERPCVGCGRNNDVGVSVCWCCGNNPEGGV